MDENEIHDIDDNLDPEVPAPVSPDREGIAWGAILLGFWSLVLIIFSVQNAEHASVNFLGWSFDMPVALLVIVTALATLVVAGVGSYFYRRRRRKRRARTETTPPPGD